MPPTYPHPVPSQTLPFIVTVADPMKVDKIPNLATLVSNVRAWLDKNANGVQAHSLVDFSKPGSVLILGDGATVKDADVQEPDKISKISGKVQKGRLIKGKEYGAAADVLNGRVPNPGLNAFHTTWQAQNEVSQQGLPKEMAKNKNKLITTDTGVIENSQAPTSGGKNSAMWDYTNKRIYINAHVEDGSMIVHEYFHTFDQSGQGPDTFGWNMDEGFTDFFARDVATVYKYPYKGNWAYENGYRAVKAIVDVLGLDRVCRIYFERPDTLITLVKGPSLEVTKVVQAADQGTFDVNAQGSKTVIDRFIQAARSWPSWPKKQWEVKVPVNPFRSLG